MPRERGDQALPQHRCPFVVSDELIDGARVAELRDGPRSPMDPWDVLMWLEVYLGIESKRR